MRDFLRRNFNPGRRVAISVTTAGSRAIARYLCNRRHRMPKELGEPELGFLLVCSSDFPFAEGFGPDIKLTGTQTIMQGASHCDFRYRRQKN
jgi:hypothetical protein